MKLIIDIPEDIQSTIESDEFINREQLAVLQMHILNGIPLKDEVMLATLLSLVADKDYKPKLEGEKE